MCCAQPARTAGGTAASPIVDGGNRAVFRSTESYTEHVATARKIPMRRTSGVFVFQPDARSSNKSSRFVTITDPVDEDEVGNWGFRWQA